MISEAFLLFFVEAIGHYGQHIHTQQGGKKLFKKEEFIKGAASSSLEQLLEWFVETQMFEVFMTKELEKSDWGNTLGKECKFYFPKGVLSCTGSDKSIVQLPRTS